MKTFICQICGDAYLGEEKPKNCPFCGARENFIKVEKETNPIINQENNIGEVSKGNLLKTLELEIHANAIYLCMAGKTQTYEIEALYKRLAKVELEHANIVCKLLKIEMTEINPESCSDEDIANFQKTIELEENASNLYARFAKEADETNIKIFFTALKQAEMDHINLINNYIK